MVQTAWLPVVLLPDECATSVGQWVVISPTCMQLIPNTVHTPLQLALRLSGVLREMTGLLAM